MAALKGYPSYRDSGLPWLGEIPEHWDVMPIGRIGRLFKGNGGSKSDNSESGVACVRYGELYTTFDSIIDRIRTRIPADCAPSYTPIHYGDILFAASGETVADIGRSAAVLLNEPAVCGGDIIVLRPRIPVVPKFLGFAGNAPPIQVQKSRFATGSTVKHLSADALKRIFIALPPEEEQNRIADFLDAHGRLTTRLIRNKRRLIGLLNEKRQAIINRAVTRGLNPDAPMKPTGIDWMPEVPAHWEVKPLKQICEVLFSNVDKHSHDDELPVRLCNYTDVYKNDFITSDMDFMTATATPAEIERFHLKIGDVMITKDSEAWDDIGVPAIVTEALEGVLCGYHLALLRAERDALLPMFLFRALTAPSIAQQLYVEATGVTRYGLSKQAIKNLLLPVPPLREQSDLVDAMAAAIEPLSALVERVNQEISLVREYRERLIADVVTGKLDVRHIEIAAPADEPVAEEDDALDEDLEAEDTDELTEALD